MQALTINSFMCSILYVTCNMSGVPTDLDTVCAGEHVLAADQRAPAHELHRAATERAHGRHPGLAASHARLPRHDEARGVTVPGQPCTLLVLRRLHQELVCPEE